MPRVLEIDRTAPLPEVLRQAVRVFERGGLVAFPTETVYGLGARGLHGTDVLRIFAAKRRPHGHPLILHVTGQEMAASVARAWPSQASRLADAFWPGPLTLVVPRGPSVPIEVTGGLDAVGVRCPRHAVAHALVREVGEPLAAPSANAHMHISPTTAEHVVRSLGENVDLVLDAGPCAYGIESTVVDLAGASPRVLRPGALGIEALRAVVPELSYVPTTVAADEARASPGLASKHYAPRARVIVVRDPLELAESALSAGREGKSVFVVLWSERAHDALSTAETLAHRVSVHRLASDAEAYARALFATFYEADEAGSDIIFVEHVPEVDAWWAVIDRLKRAAEAT